jgi:hypothetical protein
MTHPDIAAALMRERSRTLLAKAESVRLAKQARQAANRNKPVTRGAAVRQPGGGRLTHRIPGALASVSLPRSSGRAGAGRATR